MVVNHENPSIDPLADRMNGTVIQLRDRKVTGKYLHLLLIHVLKKYKLKAICGNPTHNIQHRVTTHSF